MNRFEVLNATRIDDFTTQSPVTVTTTEIVVTKSTEMPDDCMYSKFEDLENNLKVMFTEALNQTEHNLKNSQLDTCAAVNNQSVAIIQEEFSKLDEKLFAHATEMRSEFLTSIDVVTRDLRKRIFPHRISK